MARAHWPALDIHLGDTPERVSDRLHLVLAILDDFSPSALDEPLPGLTGLRAYFTDDRQRDRAAEAVLTQLSGAGVTAVPIDVADEGWAERSQSLLTPVRVGRIVVTPPWHRDDGHGDVIRVTINPSMGFGTGHHQTTRLCLAALQDLELEARTVLDIGTGSGVLAIAAIALGAARAIGIDTDADALQAADENVVLNGMSERVRLRVADFRTPAFPDLGDIVTANLTGPMLATSAQELIACTVPGGTLVLSGFVVAERDIVLGAFAEATRFARESAEDEWAAAVLEMA